MNVNVRERTPGEKGREAALRTFARRRADNAIDELRRQGYTGVVISPDGIALVIGEQAA
jgi:hypothetical protein